MDQVDSEADGVRVCVSFSLGDNGELSAKGTRLSPLDCADPTELLRFSALETILKFNGLDEGVGVRNVFAFGGVVDTEIVADRVEGGVRLAGLAGTAGAVGAVDAVGTAGAVDAVGAVGTAGGEFLGGVVDGWVVFVAAGVLLRELDKGLVMLRGFAEADGVRKALAREGVGVLATGLPLIWFSLGVDFKFGLLKL